MSRYEAVGKSVPRKEAKEKVTGRAIYTNDISKPGLLYAAFAVSPHAHAKILSIDVSEARNMPGVRAVVTGEDFPYLIGSPLEDRPPLALGKVRHYGEPVAIVVADHEHQARGAAQRIRAQYEPLPAVNSPSEAMERGARLIHENLSEYKQYEQVFPVPGTNIANHVKIRKGDMEKGWIESEVIVEASFSFPQSDHAAMEPRCAIAEIMPEGKITIHSASQSPFIIKSQISKYFHLDPSHVIVHTPLVGGAFGGKAAIQLEFLAVLASRAVGGRKVKLANMREHDFISSPVHIGLDARVKLGSTRDGEIMAAEIVHLFDGGAYSDRAAIITRAGAVDCTGPYRIDNVKCDSFCMYTNHPYATSFRGFGHPELTFAIERTMDLLAQKLGMDPLELRLHNAIGPGDSTPTQTVLTESTIGDLPQCIAKLKRLIRWDEEPLVEVDQERHKVRARGVCCIWKTSNIPADAGSGAVILFHPNGSVNLLVGSVEIGQGNKTVLAQILAERLKMDVNQINVKLEVDTESMPEHWKTVASRSTFMVGRAVLAAVEDAIRQLRSTASIALRSPPEDLEIGGGRVYLRDNPRIGIEIGKVVHGYKYPNGNTVGGQVIGRGSYVMRHLTALDPDTGRGVPGPEWTVGAQAVEVELDTREWTYEILKAATVIDAGKVINPKAAEGQITGGMSIGLSFASREAFVFSKNGIIMNPQFRTYKLIRYGEQPEYLVEFVEKPHLEAPYGLRGIGEHGVIGMPAALANALTAAAGVALNGLPLTPEFIWRTVKGGRHDSV